jgi:hypothetical protein
MTTENIGLMTNVKANGDKELIYPITKAEAVDGLDEAIGAVDVEAAKTAATQAAAAIKTAQAAREAAVAAQAAAEKAASGAAAIVSTDTTLSVAGAPADAAAVGDAISVAQYDQAVYSGVDLSVKFANEITNYSSVWAWIKARIKAANYDGIHVGDYIPFTTTNGVSLNAQVAGIDTYTNYGDTTVVGHHIDFICVELWPTRHVFNNVNFNNGISTNVAFPWLASDLYHYCNSLAGTVPSTAAVGGGDGTAVDYTADGIYYYLPTTLKSVIIKKQMLLPKRYSTSGLLSNDNGWGWTDAGYLWLPTEWEVYGGAVWGNTGYGSGGSAVQYPLFAHGMRRVKKCSGIRGFWWLLSASSGNSGAFAFVHNLGLANYGNASYNTIAAPVCFRVG